MSDRAPRPGWWRANDGRWYPPERHPDFVPPRPPPLPPQRPARRPVGPPGTGRTPLFSPPQPTGPQRSGQRRTGQPPTQARVDWWETDTPSPPLPPVSSPPGSTGTRNFTAIVSLAFGVLGFVIWGLGAVLAIVLGHRALGQIARSEQRERGRGLAMAGLALGYLQLVAAVVALVILALGGFTDDENVAARNSGSDSLMTSARGTG
jgi:hypothetical protein